MTEIVFGAQLLPAGALLELLNDPRDAAVAVAGLHRQAAAPLIDFDVERSQLRGIALAKIIAQSGALQKPARIELGRRLPVGR